MEEKEYTVDDRAQIVARAMPPVELNEEEDRQLSEAIFTLSEAGIVPFMDTADATNICALVEMIRAGKFTEEMRLYSQKGPHEDLSNQRPRRERV